MAHDEVENVPEVTKKADKDFKFRLNFHVQKKVLIWIILPVIILGLLILGLVQQGIVGSWVGAIKRADITIAVVDPANKPIETAQVIVDNQDTTTDAQGHATLTGLESGNWSLEIRKSGFITLSQSVKLKRGHNDLGSFTLQTAPVAKVNLSLSVIDYVSEAAITDASISLTDLKPILQDNTWLFNSAPVGSYTLSVTRNGYTDFSSKITVDTKTNKLDTVKLVPSGVIVFESNRDQGLRGIFTANYDGSNQQPLVQRVGNYEDFSPALGPNQRKVLFISTRDGQKDNSGGYKTALYVVNLDGTNLVKVIDDADSYSAVWSPDGGFIGFTTNDANNKTVLKIYNVITKQLVGFNNLVNFYGGFTFSQDGSLVAFSATDSTTNQDSVYIANTNGSNPKAVDSQYSYSLEFTAAGKLHYSYWDGSRNRYFEYDPASGSKTEISAPPINKVGATLSPDQAHRAYVSTRDGKTNLYTSDPNGKNEKILTTMNDIANGYLLWSLDSKYIMFNVQGPGETARYIVAASGSAKAKKIVDINLGSGYGNY